MQRLRLTGRLHHKEYGKHNLLSTSSEFDKDLGDEEWKRGEAGDQDFKLLD
ncbi:hypothetical protein I79_006872 [Cricetulus griseus]|uniref:Uncharacterized protein n=1 Tax=Cricetulus griseus TaxID=10029 RepID=G3H911_CRIGR|nr:hypothetical protein I79_006872 [Cricetulus griseus]